MTVMTAGVQERLGTGAARGNRPRSGTAAARRPAATGVRLTRRGRILVKNLVTVAALLVVALAWLVGAARAQAAGPGAARHDGVYRNLAAMVVRPGQTLWSIALQAQPTADPRVVVQEIVDLNALHGTTIMAGERLWVPKH